MNYEKKWRTTTDTAIHDGDCSIYSLVKVCDCGLNRHMHEPTGVDELQERITELEHKLHVEQEQTNAAHRVIHQYMDRNQQLQGVLAKLREIILSIPDEPLT